MTPVSWRVASVEEAYSNMLFYMSSIPSNMCLVHCWYTKMAYVEPFMYRVSCSKPQGICFTTAHQIRTANGQATV